MSEWGNVIQTETAPDHSEQNTTDKGNTPDCSEEGDAQNLEPCCPEPPLIIREALTPRGVPQAARRAVVAKGHAIACVTTNVARH